MYRNFTSLGFTSTFDIELLKVTTAREMYHSLLESLLRRTELSAQCQTFQKPTVIPRGGDSVSCEYGSAKCYAYFAMGGMFSCGVSKAMVVPIDLVKCRIQIDSAKYKNMFHGLRLTFAEEGMKGLTKGWAPSILGDSVQGLVRFGFYESAKKIYGDALGEEKAYLYRTYVYLAAGATAEIFAAIALCPLEAVKVRMQTRPGWATTLRDAIPRAIKEEGIRGLYKGLVPLWCRQIPNLMIMFASYERTLEALYKYMVPRPRSECSKVEQLVVTFLAGSVAGVCCTIGSHPADTIVSKINKEKGGSIVQTARSLGFFGLWKGLLPRMVLVVTCLSVQWAVYDAFKIINRLPRPPPPEMPASLREKQ